MREQIPKILKEERSCKSQIWVNKQEFEIILPGFSVLDKEDRKKRSAWKRPYGGKPPVLKDSLERLFFILWYLRVYPTYDSAWAIRWMSKVTAYEQVQRYFPLLQETLKRLGVLPPETIWEFIQKYGKERDFWELFVDASERKIVRNKKK